MHLRHLHIRSPIPYIYSLRIQEALVEKHFAYKTLLRNDASLGLATAFLPQPTLLTFQTHPTYTVGRRHLTTNPLSPAQVSFLTGTSSTTNTGQHGEPDRLSSETEQGPGNLATFYPSPRGGLLTYHAPGQLTAYLILNLRTHNLTPRCYIRLLENTVMRTCALHGVPNTMVTEDPGVWITEKSTEDVERQIKPEDAMACVAGSPGSADVDDSVQPTDRKICAIGVHVSRGITSHGIGLNVFDAPIRPDSAQQRLYTLPVGNVYTGDQGRTGTDMIDDEKVPAPGYLSWGFSRIVACGLAGKSVTWLDREQESRNTDTANPETSRTNVQIDAVAQSLASEVARSLNLEHGAIESISEKDILEG